MIYVGCSGLEDCTPRFIYGGCATIIGGIDSETCTLTGKFCDLLPIKDTIFFLPTFGGDWVAIFEPIWHDFSLGGGQVAGDRTNSVAPTGEDETDDFLGIIPHDYFKLN